ncbi:MAG: immune inhibitor A [Myxococcales bacterium]|nr:immune inhibitor A [Myxococcales bacterium]
MALAVALGCGCSTNTRPILQPVADTTFFVGNEGQIDLRAFDADGDDLTYSYSVPGIDISDRAQLRNFVDRAIFTWTPVAADVGSHAIDFVVSDGSDSDRESSVIVVKSSTGPGTAPRFIQPLGGGAQLDLNERDCITVDVLIDDPDSTQVEITQRQPIPGSELRTQGGLAAIFEWCPTDEQAKVATWALNLVADDKDNPPVTKLFSIIVVPKGRTPDGGIRPDMDTTPDTQPPTPDSGPVGLTAPVTIDFESDNGGFNAKGDWEWGTPAYQSGGTDCSTSATPPTAAHSGSKVWGTKLTTCYSALSNNADPCKNADITDDSVLAFKVTIPASLSKPKLVYYQWADFFLPFDWAEVRVDGNNVVEQQCSGNFTAPTGWEKRDVDLSAYSGKTVTIAFHFMSSGVVNYSGWYIDDISVVAGN